jgi:hypothetical protein
VGPITFAGQHSSRTRCAIPEFPVDRGSCAPGDREARLTLAGWTSFPMSNVSILYVGNMELDIKTPAPSRGSGRWFVLMLTLIL